MASLLAVALGGNAILRRGQKGTADEQASNIRESCRGIVELLRKGHSVVLTHGNGPQVGNIMLQNAAGRGRVPDMPLDVCGAESQGMLGYLIQRELTGSLAQAGLARPVVTVVTQVVVDERDPAFERPTKPIGPFYTRVDVEEKLWDKGQVWVEDAGRGWRRVVASPEPVEIVEAPVVRALLAGGVVVVAVGGGGIPVVRDERTGRLRGIEAVVDKDLATAMLADAVGADMLLLATDVDRVALHYGEPNQVDLETITVDEARDYLARGEFKEGSMKPKIQAAVRFVTGCRGCGSARRAAVVCSLGAVADAADGRAGTRIIPVDRWTPPSADPVERRRRLEDSFACGKVRDRDRV